MARTITRRWLDALRSLWSRGDADLDGLDEELAHHMERLERAGLACGLNEHEARAEAHRRFGDVRRARRRTAGVIRKEQHMLKIAIVLGGLVLIGSPVAAWSLALEDQTWQKVAPFTGVRFEAGAVLVEHAGDWWRLDAIEGVAADELYAASALAFGPDLAEKRMSEDIAEVLGAAGVEAGRTVSMTLAPVAGGAPQVFGDVEMTRDNRRRVWADRSDIRANDARWSRVAPYTGLVLEGGVVRVEHNGVWHELLAIDGVETPALIASAAAAFGEERIEKRLGEDIAQVLLAAGVAPSETVTLHLRTPAGVSIEVTGVSMDAEKRDELWRSRHPARD
ncbi:MAG: hypothetical protein AAF356_09795 [Planctomycetota bacterium]